MRVFGIFYTNDFAIEIRSETEPSAPPSEIRASYGLAAMCSHDCRPNAFRTVDSRMGLGNEKELFVHQIRFVRMSRN